MRTGLLHTAFIGDLILLSGAIEALHKSGHELVLITNEHGRKIYRNDNRINELIVIDKSKGLKKVSSIFNNAQKIRELQLDLLISPHRSHNSALMGSLSGAAKKASFDSFFHRLLGFEVVPFRKDLHELQRLLKLVEPYSEPDAYQDVWSLNRPVIRFNSPDRETEQAVGSGFSISKPFLIVAPGSVWGTKIFPPEKLSLVIGNLFESSFIKECWNDLQIVITGSPADRDTCQKLYFGIIERGKHLKSRVFDTTGRLQIETVGSLLTKASALIGNDSAPTHLASCTNTPSVIFFGPTSPNFGFAPLSNRSTNLTLFSTTGYSLKCQPCSPHGPRVCPKRHHRCMKDIPENAIVDVIIKTLQLK